VKDELASDLEKVGQLAARWSLNPAALSSGSWTGLGFVDKFQPAHQV
jgi:hypothetical protein